MEGCCAATRVWVQSLQAKTASRRQVTTHACHVSPPNIHIPYLRPVLQRHCSDFQALFARSSIQLEVLCMTSCSSCAHDLSSSKRSASSSLAWMLQGEGHNWGAPPCASVTERFGLPGTANALKKLVKSLSPSVLIFHSNREMLLESSRERGFRLGYLP